MKLKQDNKAIEEAFEKFEDVLDVISAMLNDDYISVSNFARVLNKILDTDRVTASKLNRVLAKVGVIKKVNKKDYDLVHQQGVKASKYILGDTRLTPYSKLKYCDNYSFYMFHGSIYLLKLEIDVIHNEVTDEMAIKLIDRMKRKKYVDVNTVKANLKRFQLIMLNWFPIGMSFPIDKW